MVDICGTLTQQGPDLSTPSWNARRPPLRADAAALARWIEAALEDISEPAARAEVLSRAARGLAQQVGVRCAQQGALLEALWARAQGMHGEEVRGLEERLRAARARADRAEAELASRGQAV